MLYELLPKMGELTKWILEKEVEAKLKFGYPLNLTIKETDNRFAIDSVCKLVSDVLSIPMNEILSVSRTNASKEARQIVMYLCRRYINGLKLKDIATYFEKDHTTVMHSYAKIEDLLTAADENIVIKVTNCENELLSRINPQV